MMLIVVLWVIELEPPQPVAEAAFTNASAVRITLSTKAGPTLTLMSSLEE